MVDRLSASPSRRHGLCRALLLLVASLLPGVAAGQVPLADPTRPPAGIESGAVPAEVAGSQLQSVLIPKKGTPVAVIGGQTVPLGGRYGDSTLVRISEREAVLEGPGGVERLLLTPAAEKTNVVTRKTTVRKAPE